jgi:hypothetical protein
LSRSSEYPEHVEERLAGGEWGHLEGYRNTQEMAAHESPRTTKLHDRARERLTQDQLERIRRVGEGDCSR